MAFDREDTLRKAEKLLRQGRLEAAINEYLRVVGHQPGDLNTANVLGDLYIRSGQTEAAVAQYSRIAEHLAQEGFLPKAAALYKKIVKITPEDESALLRASELSALQGLTADARFYLSAAYQLRLRRGDRFGAASLATKLASLDPSDLAGRLNAARANAEWGDRAAAARQFKGVAVEMAQRGQAAEASQALSEAVRLDPSDVEARKMLVQGLLARGDVDGARKFATAPEDLRTIASELLVLGREDEALQLLSQVLAADPEDVDARLRLAKAHVARRDLDQASRVLWDGAAGENPQILLTLAEVELRANHIPEAGRVLRNLLLKDQDQTTQIVMLGCALGETDPEAGFECIAAVVDRAAASGDLELALSVLERFVARAKAYIPALLRLLDICVDGNFEHNLYRTQVQLCDAYLAAGHWQEARDLSEDLVDRRPDEAANVERLRTALGHLEIPDPDQAIADRLRRRRHRDAGIALGPDFDFGPSGATTAAAEPESKPPAPRSARRAEPGAIEPPAAKPVTQAPPAMKPAVQPPPAAKAIGTEQQDEWGVDELPRETTAIAKGPKGEKVVAEAPPDTKAIEAEPQVAKAAAQEPPAAKATVKEARETASAVAEHKAISPTLMRRRPAIDAEALIRERKAAGAVQDRQTIAAAKPPQADLPAQTEPVAAAKPPQAEPPTLIEPVAVTKPPQADLPAQTEPVAAAKPPRAESLVPAGPPTSVEPVAVAKPPQAEPATSVEPVAVAKPPQAEPSTAAEPPTKSVEPVAATKPSQAEPPTPAEPVAAAKPPRAESPTSVEPIAAPKPPQAEPATSVEPVAVAKPPQAELPAPAEPVAVAKPPQAEPPTLVEPVAVTTPPRAESLVPAGPPTSVEPVAAPKPPRAEPLVPAEPVAAAKPPQAEPPAPAEPPTSVEPVAVIKPPQAEPLTSVEPVAVIEPPQAEPPTPAKPIAAKPSRSQPPPAEPAAPKPARPKPFAPVEPAPVAGGGLGQPRGATPQRRDAAETVQPPEIPEIIEIDLSEALAALFTESASPVLPPSGAASPVLPPSGAVLSAVPPAAADSSVRPQADAVVPRIETPQVEPEVEAVEAAIRAFSGVRARRALRPDSKRGKPGGRSRVLRSTVRTGAGVAQDGPAGAGPRAAQGRGAIAGRPVRRRGAARADRAGCRRRSRRRGVVRAGG